MATAVIDQPETASATPPHDGAPARTGEARRAARDSLIVALGGQIEQVLGTLNSFAMRWMLGPASIGVYTGLRLYLDNTNRSSLGVSLGAAQEVPILRAAGRHEEARRVANVAYTTNTLTCVVYALALLAWTVLRLPILKGDPLAAEWTWGLVMVAGMTIVKRYQDFLIVILRAHQEFALLTRMAVLDAFAATLGAVVGIALAGLWGLLASVCGLLLFNIYYLHRNHPWRFAWAWDWRMIVRLVKTGLPILANTAVFGAVSELDQAIILWRIPEGAKAAGLYTVALMGTSWGLDLAGRIAIVMYTYFQTTFGKTSDAGAVLRQAARTTRVQAPILGAGAAVAYLVGPTFLGFVLPKYAAGLPALRPLLPGTILLGLAWPARQALITIDRPFRLFFATLAGLAVTAFAALAGASSRGIVGVAQGMTVGYLAVYLLTTFVAFSGEMGVAGWLEEQLALAKSLGWYAAGVLCAAHAPLGFLPNSAAFALRCGFLVAWGLPALWIWGARENWGGLFDRKHGAIVRADV